jgi:hypothetical protein
LLFFCFYLYKLILCSKGVFLTFFVMNFVMKFFIKL